MTKDHITVAWTLFFLTIWFLLYTGKPDLHDFILAWANTWGQCK